MEFKWLEGNEAVDALNPTIREQGWMELNGSTCRALAAYEGEELVGFFVCQLVPFLGPAYMAPHHRDTNSWLKMVGAMRNYLEEAKARGYVVIADNPATQKMCEREKLERVESPVFVKTT